MIAMPAAGTAAAAATSNSNSGDDSDDGPRCQLEGRYLPPDLFDLDACARCYSFMPNNTNFFIAGSKWVKMVVNDVTYLTFNGTRVSEVID